MTPPGKTSVPRLVLWAAPAWPSQSLAAKSFGYNGECLGTETIDSHAHDPTVQCLDPMDFVESLDSVERRGRILRLDLQAADDAFLLSGFNHASHPPLNRDSELSWLHPPTNPLDVAAWDRYWTDQVEHGLEPRLFDMCRDDRDLVTVMNSEGLRRVLCAGGGVSQEPRALAEAGFEVVALDLSPQAIEIARSFEFFPEDFEYFCEPAQRQQGGHVKFVVGDILDSTICPGPYDVIIERLTAQLYFTHDLRLL